MFGNPYEKLLIILRGPSRSGKSTLVKRLKRKYDKIYIFSTDYFFFRYPDEEHGSYLGEDDINNRFYDFDPSLIAKAHQWNIQQTEKAMQDELSPIIIDNTNLEAWEAKPYIQLALKYGYKVKIMEPPNARNISLEELKRRALLDKEKLIPEHVIEKQYLKFKSPTSKYTVKDVVKQIFEENQDNV